MEKKSGCSSSVPRREAGGHSCGSGHQPLKLCKLKMSLTAWYGVLLHKALASSPGKAGGSVTASFKGCCFVIFRVHEKLFTAVFSGISSVSPSQGPRANPQRERADFCQMVSDLSERLCWRRFRHWCRVCAISLFWFLRDSV